MFVDRTSEHIMIDANGKREKYELLNIVQFNSTRKRMTVVLRNPDGSITAYVKGADTIMQELLNKESLERDWPTTDEHLHFFAKDGLRTLVLAERKLDIDWYMHWAEEYMEAETSLDDRDEKVRFT